MSEDAIEGGTSTEPAGVTRTLSKKDRRDQRRQAAREAAQREAEELDLEPEPEPTVCSWCGASAFFDDEASDEDKAKCPACAIEYRVPHSVMPESATFSDEQQSERDAVHRRIASALDNLYALFSGIYEDWQEAAQGRGR